MNNEKIRYANSAEEQQLIGEMIKLGQLPIVEIDEKTAKDWGFDEIKEGFPYEALDK